jgi:uncharacterized protein YjbI with pentapeptide repeats
MNAADRSPNLQRRSFRSANLRGANFSGVNLSGVDFTDAILDGANFSHADLRGTIFRRSSLIGANLQQIQAGISKNHALILQIILFISAVLLGLLAGFVGSAISGLVLNESKVLAPYQEIEVWLSWGRVSALLAINCGVIYSSSVILLKNPLMAVLGGVSSVIILGAILAFIVIYACAPTGKSWEFVGQMVVAVEGASTMTTFQIIFVTIGLAIITNILNTDRQTLVATIIGVILAVASAMRAASSLYLQVGIVLIASMIIYLALIMGKHARVESQNYPFIRSISIDIATYYGTCFSNANLTNANLEDAVLVNTNLSKANLTRTNFHGARQLNSAKVNRTVLMNPLVRDLLVNYQGSNCSYSGCDLHGAYLAGANLINADFTGANLSDSNLKSARLDRANLTRILAVGADLEGASLTGVCIADWSIDRTTKLDDIICEYLYLKSPGEDRNPASGIFSPGDFTQLFQQIWNTIDLIFHEGIDWASFSTAWQQIQIENDGVPLAIHSIERKGEGTILVKVEVPQDFDKARLHESFDRSYQLLLNSIEDRHQAELTGRDRELAMYKEQQDRSYQILQSLVSPPAIAAKLDRVVTIKLGARDIDRNLAVSVEIGDRGHNPHASATGILGCEDDVIAAYHHWQTVYRQHLTSATRIDIPSQQNTNLKQPDRFSNAEATQINKCQLTAQTLKQEINQWLDSSKFKSIRELMLQELHPTESIQIVLQTDELGIRQLPFQLWDFFDRFTHAEISIASNNYRSIVKHKLSNKNIEILAVFGSSEGLNLEFDRQSLTKIPNARVEFSIEPTRQILNDKLWERPWDIIFFAGHSASEPNLATGHLQINSTDKLTIPELKYALERSIETGLKLVILNSCDSLGLAAELISIQLPQAIVMREPVPDIIAQQFLKNFLTAFASGLPLYRAVRSAREQLQGLEDTYPCASWLPVICQNPAEI